MRPIVSLIIFTMLLSGCPWFKSDEVEEGEWKHASQRIGGEISKYQKTYPHIASLLKTRWEKALVNYKVALKIKDQSKRVDAMKAALAPCDEAIQNLSGFESDHSEVLKLVKQGEKKLTNEQRKEYVDKVEKARSTLQAARPADGELDSLLKKAREETFKWRNAMQKIAFSSDKPDKPDEASARETITMPVIEPGKGVQKMVLPGVKDPLDITLGMDLMKLADPAGIEIGEHHTKYKGKPHKISISNNVFMFDSNGKLVWFIIALADLSEGISAFGVTLPKEASLGDLKKLLKGCSELEPAGKAHMKLQCMEGKLQAYQKKAGKKAALFFTTSMKKYPFPV